ncbi:hypothetical protein EVAR_74234_1 [Eumeta japonica]|uniref:Uncharacterized protein n=1 Tax=Eumeta variegata TaxID=151549 RepID=A0A4C1SDB1_EUMVA|nr:hypothetical protein EVAR_74234_1 [Eumeta japonica]
MTGARGGGRGRRARSHRVNTAHFNFINNTGARQRGIYLFARRTRAAQPKGGSVPKGCQREPNTKASLSVHPSVIVLHLLKYNKKKLNILLLWPL